MFGLYIDCIDFDLGLLVALRAGVKGEEKSNFEEEYVSKTKLV